MNIAIILAGGSGSRFGADRPKQFLEIAGKTVLEHTIEAFEQNAGIDRIAIVSRKDFVDDVQKMVDLRGYTKVEHVLCGGKERYHSTLAALEAYHDDNDVLLIHDGVRPLVSQRIINDCIDAMASNDAIVVAVPATDTILQVDEDNHIAAIPPRKMLRNAQTPQCFRRKTIRRAFDLAFADSDFQPTDDGSVVLRYLPEVPIGIVDGDPTNIKITYTDDLQLAERLLGGNKA